MSKNLMAVAVLAGALALPGIGGAQTAPRAGQGPISWGANTVEYVGETLTLRGAAELTQGRNRLRADQISGLNQNANSQLQASGNVYFVTPEQTIRGDNAVYTTGDDMIVVTGDVILTQGQNVATGSRLTYNVRTETARLEGGSNGRVRGVFYPENSGN